MSRARAGIDIGSRFLHIVVWKDKKVAASLTEPLPEGLMKDGWVVSPAAMVDLLKDLRKKNRLPARETALVLHERECFCRRVDMPMMTAHQLKMNLPYEFRDFISGNKDKYYYDYAVLDASVEESADGKKTGPGRLDLLAAAASKKSIALYRDILRRSGFKLTSAIPEEMAYSAVLAADEALHGSVCVLDLGHSEVRMFMYRDGKYQSRRSLDYGCGALDAIISQELGCDPFIACTYRETNYQDCQALPPCADLYNSMALEIMKAVNYYNFSTPEHPLEKIFCCGGGAATEALLAVLRETLPIPVLTRGEREGENNLSVAALGAAMQRGGNSR